MAKTLEKPVAKKKAATKKKSVSPSNGKSSLSMLEKASQNALEKLKALDMNKPLQADIEWCLGSYSYDKNPVGLYEMTKRALKFFQETKTKNSKAVPAKLLTDLEKALKN